MNKHGVVTDVIATVNGSKEYSTVVGDYGGATAVAFGDVNLLGVGKLMKSLGKHGSFIGDADKMQLLYKGNVFFTGEFGDDCIPWGNLTEFKDNLAKLQEEQQRKIFMTSGSRNSSNNSNDSRDSDNN